MAPELPPSLPPANNTTFNPSEEPLEDLDIPVGPRPIPIPHPTIRSVRGGCWLTTFKPTGAPLSAYDGTIRVETHAAGRTASGDLYQRPITLISPGPGHPIPTPVLGPAPNPTAGIPIQPLNRYRYYLSITKILEGSTVGNSFELGFNRWRYTAPTAPAQAGTWTNDGAFTATMSWVAAPPGYPSPLDYLQGDVKNAAGSIVGRLNMGWISTYYRKAVLEIDSVTGSERPLDDGAGRTWRSIFGAVGFDFNVILSQTNVAEPSGPSWNYGELHAGMIRWRDTVNLNTQWRYHLLCVKLIDETPRGVMYDTGATDSNKIAREGAAVATHFTHGPGWGDASGKRWGSLKPPYFRSAVHEIGHAMSLEHNYNNQQFMDTSDTIAAAGEAHPPKFWHNIKWSFADTDLRSLRHWPDIFIRPGGVPFGVPKNVPTISPPDNAVEMPDFKLEVTPVLSEVPLGAPVRLELKLANIAEKGGATAQVPASISLKSGYVQGSVTSASGVSKIFKSIIISGDTPLADLAPGQSVSSSLVLLRGPEGALFPSAGIFDVSISVSWPIGDAVANIITSTSTLVTGTQSASHAAAAHQLLTTPDVHLVLIFGGDHLEDGIAAIQKAVKDDVLRPHFAAIEAKRLVTRFMERKPKTEEARKLIDERTVLSNSEKAKLDESLK